MSLSKELPNQPSAANDPDPPTTLSGPGKVTEADKRSQAPATAIVRIGTSVIKNDRDHQYTESQRANTRSLNDNAKEPRLQWALEEIVERMQMVELQTSTLGRYIHTNSVTETSIYTWPKYEHYHHLDRATYQLDKSLDKAKLFYRKSLKSTLPISLMNEVLHQALALSTSTSNTIAVAMAAVDIQLARCEQETDSSTLSKTRKDTARTDLPIELRNLIQHCRAITTTVYPAVEFIKYVRAHPRGRPSKIQSSLYTWKWQLVRDVICFACIAVLFIKHSSIKYPTEIQQLVPQAALSNFPLSHSSNAQRKSENLEARIQHLETFCNDQGFRIDHIWDSLGPPNENGTYYSSTDHEDASKSNTKSKHDRGMINQRLENVEDEIENIGHYLRGFDKRLREIHERRTFKRWFW